MRIELTSPAWEAGVIAIIRRPRMDEIYIRKNKCPRVSIPKTCNIKLCPSMIISFLIRLVILFHSIYGTFLIQACGQIVDNYFISLFYSRYFPIFHFYPWSLYFGLIYLFCQPSRLSLFRLSAYN